MNIELNDIQPVKGTLEMTIHRRGQPDEHVVEHNIVVDGGRNRLARLISGTSIKGVTQIGFGTGDTIPKLSDTSLTNQFCVNVVRIEVEGNDAIFKWSLNERQPAEGMDIREFGLFTSDGVMVTRLVRAKVIGKDSDMTIDGTYTLHF